MSTPESSISRYLGRFRGAGVATAFFLLAAAAVAAAQFGDTTSNLDLSASASQQALVPAEPPLLPVPRAVCGPGARQETGIQGRISRADHESGLAALGLRCNTQLVGQHTQEKAGQDGTIVGTVGGYKVLRYKDKLGNECAYYDTSLLPPTNAGDGNLGVRVLDMHDPSKPALSMNLTSPAMSFPHESLILSEKRGLLMAVAGNLSQTLLPGQVDIYDLEATPGFGCKVPKLLSSTPLGIWGHESGLAPDGNTFYASSLSNETVTALDISDPVVPRLLVHQSNVAAHGLSLSDDGKTAYVARGQNKNGLEIYDVSSIQNREANPRMVFVSKLTWNQMSVPQSTVPITIGGKPFVIESDEFLRNGTDRTGASRIIDISDPKTPFVISNLRLEVHQEANRINGKLQDDPGTTANGTNTFAFAQDYTGHFCNVPTKVDPPIVACGMSISGLRIFNIEDPYNPREVGYFTAPVQKKVSPEGSNWAYSQPVFAPERKEVWYSEAYTGFYAVKLTNGAWPDAGTSAMTTQATVTVPVGSPISDTATVSGIVTPSGATSTGTIEFSAYGPDDATCTVSAFTSAPIPVNDRRQYKSGEFTPSQAGVYRWIARYSGDSLNAPVSGRCDEANETSTVRKRTPTLATSAMRTASVGQSISDTATVTGVYQTTGATGTGTIRFDLYAPGDTTCANRLRPRASTAGTQCSAIQSLAEFHEPTTSRLSLSICP